MKNKDKPLTVEVKDNKLIISIGIDTLAFVAERCPHFYNYDKHNNEEKYVTVVDNNELAHDVVRALTDEEEDGSTILHRLIDDAIEDAYEDGSLGFFHD